MRTLAAIAIVAFVGAYVANREFPEKFAPPPSQPKAVEVLQQGRDLFDRWNNPKTRESVSLAAVSQTIAELARVPNSDPLYATTRKAIDVLRPLRQELQKQEDQTKAAQKGKEKAEQARFLRDVILIRHLRSSMNNPESFRIDKATRMKDGTLCLTYRTTNGFNAVVVGQAVIDTDEIVTSDDRDRFTGVWNRLCANKPGVDIEYFRNEL